MRNPMSAALAALLCSTPLSAQEIQAPVAAPTVAVSENIVVLKQDTPLELMAASEITTDKVTAGSQFKLRVNKAVVVDGKTVVPIGAWAFGEVTSAKESSGLGKSGRMTAKLNYLQLGDVQIPVEGDVTSKGQGAGSAGVALLITPWAVFHRGNNAKIKAGEIVAAFVGADTALDLSGTQPRRVDMPTAPAAPVAHPAAEPATSGASL